MSATPQQVRQWSDEVAADAGSPAFLPLAEHYRALGKGDAALRLVIRGLERHPNDVEAHYLLGCLYRDAGEQVKAFDEWDIALALAPEHHGARRQIGFLCLERGELEDAERHLERALESQFDDAEVRDALERILAERRAARGRGRGQGTGDRGQGTAGATEAPARPAVAATTSPPATSPMTAPAPSADTPIASAGEGHVFDVLLRDLAALSAERGIVGAVMLDAQGFVVAGEMHVGGRDRGPEIAAVLSPASDEAQRAVRHLKLGAWKGIMVETPDAVIRLSPTPDGGMVAVAGRRDVPMGWVLRVAARARDAAVRFLGGGAP
ncbi:roadblock/LC7 domain-containing protein [Longimicrobium sp.]|uniref:roadblock/LC7 domain-containing protein n=1 Tax=Longimicrobium sp. TaxID=2029185 RepID=UPI002BAB46C8|nr:tetratricopeptide repeat protein [Longimicrobium sp.]HSU17921.1 tetratricopeptide repeat protein [Longimicrobium sp.]